MFTEVQFDETAAVVGGTGQHHSEDGEELTRVNGSQYISLEQNEARLLDSHSCSPFIRKLFHHDGHERILEQHNRGQRPRIMNLFRMK